MSFNDTWAIAQLASFIFDCSWTKLRTLDHGDNYCTPGSGKDQSTQGGWNRGEEECHRRCLAWALEGQDFWLREALRIRVSR